MPEFQRVEVNLPAKLVTELDLMTGSKQSERNQAIAEAMEWYLFRRKQQALRQQLKNGYQEMADINRALAEEGWRELGDEQQREVTPDFLLEGD